MNEAEFDKMADNYFALFEPFYISLLTNGEWIVSKIPPKNSDDLVKCYYKPPRFEGKDKYWLLGTVCESLGMTVTG